MNIKYKQDERLKTRCPAGRECMVASAMCKDCKGFLWINAETKIVKCSIVTVEMLAK